MVLKFFIRTLMFLLLLSTGCRRWSHCAVTLLVDGFRLLTSVFPLPGFGCCCLAISVLFLFVALLAFHFSRLNRKTTPQSVLALPSDCSNSCRVSLSTLIVEYLFQRSVRVSVRFWTLFSYNTLRRPINRIRSNRT